MSEWAILGLVALGLYLLECVAWIEAAAVACFKPPSRSLWKCGQGTSFPGNDRGGLIMADPTRLEGSVIVCHAWPFSVSPHGLTNCPADGGISLPPEVRFVAFADVRTIRAEFGEIHVNGTPLTHVSSSVLASHLARQIERIRRSPFDQRASEITNVVRATLDQRGAAAQWASFAKRSQALSLLCLALFLIIFIISPAVLLALGPYPSWMYLLAGIMGVTISTSITYFRTHAAMYPEAGYDRWVHAVSMTLLPVGAIRCVDKLSREALSRYGPAVVAPMLCGIENAVPVLRQQLIDVTSTSPDSGLDPSGAAADCVRWFRYLLATETQAALERTNVPVLKAPVPDNEAMVSYCPRCHAQFGPSAATSCPSCAGIQLVAFSTQDTAARTRA
jgi:hypothetical protein